MPVDQDAANSYENNATASKWREGTQDADSLGQGLSEAGVNMAGRESEIDSEWRDGVQEGDYEVDGQAWLDGMSDASDWNIG